MTGLAPSLRTLALVALYALLGFSAVAPGGAVSDWPLAALEVLALVGVAAWLLSGALEGRIEWARSPLGLPFLLLAGLVLAQMALGSGPLSAWATAPAGGAFALPERAPGPFFLLGTVSTWVTRQAFFLLLTYGAVYLLVVNLVTTRRALDRLVRFLLLVGSLVAFVGLLESASGALGIFSGLSEWLTPGRARAAFDNPDHFATWLGMLLALGAGFLVAHRRGRSGRRPGAGEAEPLFSLPHSRRGSLSSRDHDSFFLDVLLFFGVVVIGLALLFTLSRAGLASALLALAGLAVLLRSQRIGRRGSLLVGAVGLAVLAWAAWLGLEPVLARLDRLEADYLFRWRIYLASLPIIADYPVLGVGLGAYGEVMSIYQTADLSPAALKIDNAHSDWLQVLLETGLPGLAILVLACWRFWGDMIGAHCLGRPRCPHWQDVARTGEGRTPQRRDRHNIGIALGALAGTFMAAAHSVVDFGLRIPANGVLLAALCAVATVAFHHRFHGEATEGLVPHRILSLRGGARTAAAGATVLASLLLAGLVVAPHAVARRLDGVRERLALPATESPSPSLVHGLKARGEALRALSGGGLFAALDRGNPAPLHARATLLEELAVHAWNSGVAPDGRLLEGAGARAAEAARLLDEAREQYERAVRLAPARVESQERLAWLHANLAVIRERAAGEAARGPEVSAEMQRALAGFARVAALGRESPLNYAALAQFVAAQGAFSPAVATLLPLGAEAARRAVAAEPERLAGLFAAYLPLLGERLDPEALAPGTPEDRIHLAVLLERAGLADKAEAAYRRAVAVAPPRSQPLFRRLHARALARAGKHAEAQSQIEIALRYDPADPAVHLAMAEVLAEQGRAEQALDFHASAIAAAERRAQETAGRLPQAAPRKSSALSLEERRAQVLERLARAELGAPPPPQVSLTYPYRLALGRFHVAQKQYGQAIPILEQLTQESLTDPVARFALGQAYDAIGAWEAAVSEYRKAVDLAKDSAKDSLEYRLHLARRYFDNERYFQAIETWQVAARKQPLDVDVRLNMARAYARVGDPLQAARTYERVLQIEPGNAVALQGLQAIRGRLPAGVQGAKS